jgi:hypothetical protein
MFRRFRIEYISGFDIGLLSADEERLFGRALVGACGELKYTVRAF